MLFTLGMAHYRAGEYGEALARLEEAVKVDPAWTEPTCVTGLALSLVHHLGNREKAREWLDWIVMRLESGTQAKWPAAHIPAHPGNWVTCVILRNEAEALLGKVGDKKDVWK
jgi:hypothetical protein